jgi:hypothetical protein
LLVGEVNAKPPSHYDNNAIEATWPWHNVDAESCRRWRRRGDIGRSAMSMPSHAGNVAAEVTWSQCDVDNHATVTSGEIYI